MADFTQDILDALAPMLYYEPSSPFGLGYFGIGLYGEGYQPLTTYIEGLGSLFQELEEWVSDTDNDEVGWSLVVDVNRCPDDGLPWLAQLVGVQLSPGLSADDQRDQIETLANWKRGTLSAIAAAPAPFLTGTKTVIIRERYDGTTTDAPYYMEVATYTSETPDPTIVEAVIRAQKPGGIILTYVTITGQDFQLLSDDYTSFQDVKDAYHSFQGIKSNLVGT